jgi:Protein of unknown function (DUF4058)
MKSPFPGMDPYLEQYWLDVHARLILYTCDQLEEQLPGSLIARVQERVVFETEESAEYWIYPDVRISARRSRESSAAAVFDRSRVAEPVIVQVKAEPTTETYIEILNPASGNRLVTVIEILSLANKLPGKGQRNFRREQVQRREARVNLVEIDLLRRGHRVLMVPVSQIPRRARSTYQVCVWRASNPDACAVYRVPLREPLPSVRIPLRERDEDIVLDLQAVVDQAYRKGRHHATIDYREPPDPPLVGDDAKWAKAVISKAKKA